MYNMNKPIKPKITITDDKFGDETIDVIGDENLGCELETETVSLQTPIQQPVSAPEPVAVQSKSSTKRSVKQASKQLPVSSPTNKTAYRPVFSVEDTIRFKTIQFAYEFTYKKRINMATMFFTMLDKHIEEDYPEMAKTLELLTKLK